MLNYLILNMISLWRLQELHGEIVYVAFQHDGDVPGSADDSAGYDDSEGCIR